jgi:MscS family membrane protein
VRLKDSSRRAVEAFPAADLYGASSLDVEIRVYALAREWNEFYAIREDVLLRVNEIVNESGTSFAFPSQTVYMGRDRGLDKDRSDEALNKVEFWRRSGQLPFPKLSASKMEQLEGTLDYPPVGSPDAISSKNRPTEVSESPSAEPLSAEPKNKDTGSAKKQAEPERQ